MNKNWGISYQDLWHMSVWSGKLLSCLSTWEIPTEIKYVSRKQWWRVFLFPIFPLLFLQDNIMFPESLWVLSQDEHQLIFYKKGNFYFPCFFGTRTCCNHNINNSNWFIFWNFSEMSPSRWGYEDGTFVIMNINTHKEIIIFNIKFQENRRSIER